MIKIYKIADDFENLCNLIADEEDLDPLMFSDQIDSFDKEFDNSAIEMAKYCLNLDVSAASIKMEVERLNARIKKFNKSSANIKSALKSQMRKMKKRKIVSPLFNIVLEKGRESVEVTDTSLLDSSFVSINVVTTPDKKEIKKAIKEGEKKAKDDGTEFTFEGARIVVGDEILKIK